MPPRAEFPARPWYSEGLRFACTGCGACCHGEGYVWVDDSEIARLTAHLGVEEDEFRRRYLRRVEGRAALVDGADTACVFWDQGCTVYAARPTQCRTFPFWKDNLRTAADWEAVAEESPGVGSGRLYTLGEIQSLARGEGAAGGDAQPTEGDGE